MKLPFIPDSKKDRPADKTKTNGVSQKNRKAADKFENKHHRYDDEQIRGLTNLYCPQEQIKPSGFNNDVADELLQSGLIDAVQLSRIRTAQQQRPADELEQIIIEAAKARRRIRADNNRAEPGPA